MFLDKAKFYDAVRTSVFSGSINSSQVTGLQTILNYWFNAQTDTDVRRLAYVLATAYHESGHTMQPVRENGRGAGHPYGLKLKRTRQAYTEPNEIYYGRGLVQLTWYENYELFGNILNLPLLKSPDLALQVDVSVRILFTGMFRGLFTGVGLLRYINADKCDYRAARQIVNGLDRADLIAGYAVNFENALK